MSAARSWPTSGRTTLRRDQLEHPIRAACQIIGHSAVIVVGSQSILGSFDEDALPESAHMSRECGPLVTRSVRAARTGGHRGARHARSKGQQKSSFGMVATSSDLSGSLTIDRHTSALTGIRI